MDNIHHAPAKIPRALRLCHERWTTLDFHPEQDRLRKEKKRFKVVPAGRRSGKTEVAKRFLAKEAMKNPGERYFCAAPTREQAKKIFWNDMKLLTFSPLGSRPPSESDLIIYLANGAEIHVIGLDKPQRIEGQMWAGGIIDEVADIKSYAWDAHIRPALDTRRPDRPGYLAWCWLIGVPDGLNHYYEMAMMAKSGEHPDWGFYTWLSSEIMDPEAVAAARATMDPRLFRQEYEAAFEGATGRIYHDYDAELNYTDAQIMPHEQLCWFHDFNYTPMSSGIAVIRRDADDKEKILCLDEIVLTSATSRQSAEEFVDKYKDHGNKYVLVYGDPAGRAGEKHGHESDYTEIETVLLKHGWSFDRRVTPAAPAIKDRQNSVRAKIMNADGVRSIFVNPVTAPTLHKGLSNVQLKKGSTFLEQDSNEQHITTAVGYFVHYEWPVIGKFDYEGAM